MLLHHVGTSGSGVSKEREALAETKATLKAHEATTVEKVKAAEEEARRRSLDDFMQEFRVEERHYVRENKSLLMRKKSVVLQERLYFRNIPLSNWVEHEMVVEENATGDLERLAHGVSIFSTSKSLTDQSLPPNLIDATKPVVVPAVSVVGPALDRAEAYDIAS